MKKLYILAIATLSLLVACQREKNPGAEPTVITVSAQQTKTALGAISGTKRPVYWADGDCLAMNGVASEPLSGVSAQATTAQFTFTSAISGSAPYNILYPASLYKNGNTVTLPATQTWAANAVVSVPLAAQVSALTGETADLAHLCAILHLRVRKNASVASTDLATVTFRGNSNEQVCGDFTIDYSFSDLSPAGGGSTEVTLSVNQPLSASEDLDLFLTIPAQFYIKGFSVTLEDASHQKMTCATASPVNIVKGQLLRSSVTYFNPMTSCKLELEGLDVESLPLDGYNVKGRVVDNAGNGLADVVVSDGLQCVRTLSDGRFYMTSNMANTKFVWVSTPSGYTATAVNGTPKFYKAAADVTPSGGIYDFGDYTLTPVANPNRFTLLISADPQARAQGSAGDNCAWYSTRCSEDLFYELREVAAGISGHQVYGICLGDLAHENLSLMETYATTMAAQGYPTYNVIGNHDYDMSAANDDEGAAPYESYFGPRNYSFNIGGIHFVMLDNIFMVKSGSSLVMNPDAKYGLSDDVLAWLEADLSYIPTSSKLMVCSHSPMFRYITTGERSNTSVNGPEYGNLINKYAEIHAWAGHTHVGFNFNYPDGHRHKRIQVHTLARSTGELWTNEYVADGTPRGFTIVEVDNGEITWKFHPTKYQKSAFHGGTGNEPAYTSRDWNYVSGTYAATGGSTFVAQMKAGGALTEDYQMHIYKPGLYEAGYAYVNIFLWDDKWGTPTFSLNGGTPVEMTHIEYNEANSYDYASNELRDHYLNTVKNSYLRSLGSDDYGIRETGLWTIFKVPCNAASGTGTVSVTDRFGNVYTQSITW
ncbi:MAG: calcineurin-like phosphoesterase C-terminal domain-containing protein [Bacteroidales bacterium]|nr:calcineurin-like phosphoesterase C-terminal domain-containing protein [Bacteroidales bacterium]